MWQKICLRYFKLSQTYFGLSPLYFQFAAGRFLPHEKNIFFAGDYFYMRPSASGSVRNGSDLAENSVEVSRA